MKLMTSLLAFLISGIVSPVVMAAQQNFGNELRQKARPDPVTHYNYLLAENVVVADAGSTVAPSAPLMQKYDAAFSVCHAAVPTTHRDFPDANVVAPMAVITTDLFYKGITIKSGDPIVVAVIESPKNGVLNTDGYAYGNYEYRPNVGYFGPDQMTFVVEVMGKKFKVIETVWVENAAPDFGCPTNIKLPPATTGNDKRGALDVIELPVDGTLDTDALAKLHAFVSFASGAGLSGNGGTINLADLPGAAIGQTTGSTITLDTNAANHNWYIDPTPGQNEEYLPTSNPNEWIAKAGSAAAGKMDMLTVLLHEYGHALGINHNPDPNDYMGATLTAGVRKLPSAEEMALMQGLVAWVKEEMVAGNTTSTPSPTRDSSLSLWERAGVREGGEDNAPTFPTLPLGTSFIGFFGLLRSNRYGGVSIVPDESRSPYP